MGRSGGRMSSLLCVAISLALCLFVSCLQQEDVTADQANSAVIGGNTADALAYGATGALIEWVSSGVPLLVCSATLIQAGTVLTAAHCVSGRDVRSLYFTAAADVGQASLSSAARGRRAYLHPSFAPASRVSLHDIAVVELERSAAAEPVADRVLESLDAGPALAAGDPVELVGYGRETADGGVVGSKNAAAARISAVSADEFRVGGPGEAQNCVGDSGGPSYAIASDASRRLVGIVSR